MIKHKLTKTTHQKIDKLKRIYYQNTRYLRIKRYFIEKNKK